MKNLHILLVVTIVVAVALVAKLFSLHDEWSMTLAQRPGDDQPGGQKDEHGEDQRPRGCRGHHGLASSGQRLSLYTRAQEKENLPHRFTGHSQW